MKTTKNIKKTIEKNNKHTKLSRRIAYGIMIIIIYNLLMVGISTILNKTGHSLFGYKALVITTDSMKPNINSGDIVIIKKVEESKIKIGDVISFKQAGGIITHRITDIKQNENNQNEYITKGDNNNIEDSTTVKYQEIEGRKVLKIPFFGKIVILLQDEVYVILLIIILLVIYLQTKQTEDKDRIRREKKEKEDEKFKNQNNNY